MKVLEVIKQMRYLSSNGIPFSVEFISFNENKGTSNGLVCVERALLRKTRATKSTTLVAYTDLDKDEPKHFHLPLLTKFNGTIINNEY